MKNKTYIWSSFHLLHNFNLSAGIRGHWLLAACIFAVCLGSPSAALAQNVQYTNQAIDMGMRNTRRVNPTTRGVEFQIPLGHYKGRGGLDIPVTLSYSSKLWAVKFQGHNPGPPPPHGGLQPFTIVTAHYSERSVAGWTSSISFPSVDTQPASLIYDQFGNPNVSGNCTSGCFKIDRIMVWMPDGSGHELRSSDQALPISQAVPDDLYAVDGSRMRYQRSSGTLFMPDGSRYLIGLGKYIDRNGNTLTAGGGGLQDTLGRQINNPLSGVPSGPGDQNVTLPGVGNNSITYTLKWLRLQDVLTTPQPLRFLANTGCPPETGGTFSPSLFSWDSTSRTCFGNASVLFNPVVLSQIVLPNGRAYTFTYNVYGEIDKVVLPTGGYERYQYVSTPPISSPLNFKLVYAQANRGVATHTVSHTGLAGDEVQWQYTGTNNSVSVTAPDGSRSESFLWVDGATSWGYSVDSARAGRPFDERIYSPSGQMLRRKLTQWTVTGSNGTFDNTTIANRNPRITRLVEFILDTQGGPALARSTTFGYDTSFQFNVGVEQTSINEFDYVEVDQSTAQTIPIGSLSSIPNGTPLRTTEIEYMTSNASYRSLNLLGLQKITRIKNGSGTVVSKSENTYDEFALLTYPSVTGWTDPATSFRGNLTTVSRWLSFDGVSLFAFPSGPNLAKHTQYDQCGSIRMIWDARDPGMTNPTQVDYSSTFQRAYATSVTSSDPDGGGPAVALTSSTDYDFSTGLITATVDPNLQRTTFDYTDPMNRLKQTIRASTDASAKNQTTYTYDDVGRTLTATSDLNVFNDNLVKVVTIYDALARLQEIQRYEDGVNYISVQQQYDAFGRITKTSNPFRPLQSEPLLWTTKVFDALGRVLTITSPDNAVVSKSYNGNSETVTDQAGKQRKNISDALGRIKQVIEAPNDAGFQYSTTYEYNAQDSLTHVIQDNQHRYFMYDSFRRLIRSRNPEQAANTGLNLTDPLTLNGAWSAGYKYDANGNVTQKTDPRGVVATLTYDNLNRNTGISYSNDPSGTLPVTFVYDTATNGKGHLHKAQTTGAAGSLTTIASYDAMGLPLTMHQQFFVSGNWSQQYTVQRQYNLASRVVSQSYPSGRSVTNTYDSAGRTASFAGTLGDSVPRTYSNEIIYSPFGGLAKERFGTATSVYNKLFYNNRGQLAEIRESTTYAGPTDTTADRGGIVNHFSDQCAGMCLPTSSMTDNNGNLRKQEVLIPSQTTRLQEYSYDAVNRLKSARELLSGVEQWKQQFTYDRFGNRTIDTGVTYGVNEKEFTVNTSNNRLGVPGGQSGTMDYDNGGNLIHDTYSGAGNRTYDAENRIVSAAGGTGTQTYTYAPSGQRVRRNVNGTETWQIYGFSGELLAEYPANGALNGPKKEYGYRNGQLLITAEPFNNLSLPMFADDFDDNSIDSSKWSVLSPGGTPAVTEESQQLKITLAPNTAAYNGVSSISTYDLTGKMLQVEVVQSVSQAGWCENMLKLTLNANNYFLIDTGATNLLMRSMVNGVNDQNIIGYDPVAHRHWRIRHDTGSNTVNFETSGDGSVWISRKVVTPGFALTSLRIELVAGAYGTGNASPGAAKYDNVKLLSSATPSSILVPNSGFETPSLGFGNFQYGPSGGFWSFINGGGISAGGSGFSPPIPEGSQVAFIQATGQFSQTLSGFQSGTNYVITFRAAQRTNCCNAGGQDIAVYIDDNLLGTYHPPANGVYVEFSTPAFTTTAGSHTVKFAGLNLLGGDHTAFVDHVRITGSPAGNGVQWLVTDHLGTPRIVLDQSGSLSGVKRHDYLPFGEELFGGTTQNPGPGGRLPSQGYASGDGVRQQFTGQERDTDTGLDYFNARYYSSTQGRFTSPDPFGGSGFASVPQSWNKYAYSLNRPFVFTDPSGLIWLTKDNQTFIWVEDAEYAKHREKYKEYSVANGAVTKYEWSLNCPQCKGLKPGQWVQLNANGSVTPVADPSTYIYGQFTYTDDEINSPVPVITGTVWYKELQGGPKNGTRRYDNDKGGHTDRWYDDNGRAWVDIDYGHDHGAGDPHVHWWDWTGLAPKRLPGEPPPEGWDWLMWDNGEPFIDPNRRRQNPAPFTIPIAPMDGTMPVRPTAPVRPTVPLRPGIPLRPILIP